MQKKETEGPKMTKMTFGVSSPQKTAAFNSESIVEAEIIENTQNNALSTLELELQNQRMQELAMHNQATNEELMVAEAALEANDGLVDSIKHKLNLLE